MYKSKFSFSVTLTCDKMTHDELSTILNLPQSQLADDRIVYGVVPDYNDMGERTGYVVLSLKSSVGGYDDPHDMHKNYLDAIEALEIVRDSIGREIAFMRGW